MKILTSQGKSIVLISHHLDEAVNFSDRITILRQGKLVEVMDGHIKEKHLASKGYGRIEAKLIFALMSYITPRNLGQVYTSDTTYVLEGTKQKIIKALMPDVSFVSTERDSDDAIR